MTSRLTAALPSGSILKRVICTATSEETHHVDFSTFSIDDKLGSVVEQPAEHPAGIQSARKFP
jgi:hypothetical protein